MCMNPRPRRAIGRLEPLADQPADVVGRDVRVAEVQDAQLLAYHDWEGELATLTSPELTDLLDQHHVSVIGYRDLGVCGDRLEVTGLRRSRGRAEGPTTVATAGAEP